jgi:glutamine synthetase
MLTEEIFTQSELESRFHVLSERYAKDILIEANTLKSMLFTAVLPCAYDIRKNLAESVVNLKSAGVSADPEKAVLKQLGDLVTNLQDAGDKLMKAIETVSALHDNADTAAASSILPLMQQIREVTDRLEQIIPDKAWPFPKYTELLFSI